MDYFFTEEQEMIRDLCRQIAEERIKPVRAELDEKEEFPHEIMKALAQADLFQIIIPEQYGGLGAVAWKTASRWKSSPAPAAAFPPATRLPSWAPIPCSCSAARPRRKSICP